MIKATSGMDSLLAVKGGVNPPITPSNFDGRSIGTRPQTGGFGQSFQNMTRQLGAQSEGHAVAEGNAGHAKTDEVDEKPLDLEAKLKRIFERFRDLSGAAPKAPNEQSVGNAGSASQETAEAASKPGDKAPLKSFSSPLQSELEAAIKMDSTAPSEESVASEISLSQVKLPNASEGEFHYLHLGQDEMPDVVMAELKNLQNELSEKGVDAPLDELIRLYRQVTSNLDQSIASGAKPEYQVISESRPQGSAHAPMQAQAPQSPVQGSQPQPSAQNNNAPQSYTFDTPSASSNQKSVDYMALSKDGKPVLSDAVENTPFASLVKKVAANQSVPESSAFRIDASTSTQKPSSPSEWSPVVVNKTSANWNKELVSALGDRLKMQVGQGVKEATVRLDPPDLGRVDFSVRIDGDRVNVQINSGNAQVREMLAQQIDRLRSDLLSDNSGSSVDVNVGDGKKDNNKGNQDFANKDNANTILPSDNDVELMPKMTKNNPKTGLNTKA